MVKKLHKSESKAAKHAQLTESVRDSAQQIWQAGLGAFTRAQAEGSKAFESLVKEGVAIQRKTQAVAEEKISEATNKMTSMATDITSKATGQWDKLEGIFEERVAKALNKLGVPSAKDISDLMARMDELNLAVKKLSPQAAARAAAPSKAKVAAKRVAKPAAQPAAKPVEVPVAKSTTEATVKPSIKTARKRVATAKPAVVAVADAEPTSDTAKLATTA